MKKITHAFTLPSLFAGHRLDQALAKILLAYSRSQIKQWIDEGSLKVDDKKVKAKMKVKGGESVSLSVILKPKQEWTAQAMPLTIVYEDEAVMVINKPVGLVVHPAPGHAHFTLLNALLHHVKTLHLLPRAGILHRLDKNTSGLLLIAKTPAALKHLQTQLKKRTLLREYQTIVFGKLISGGTIDAPIARHPLQRKSMAVVETGKQALTHYRVIEKYRSHTRLKVKLETGRTHQIRVHMAYIRHPIIGDPVYGGRLKLAKNMSSTLIDALRGFKRQALHAYTLGFTHPVTGKWMTFEAPLPDDMKELIQLLKKDNVSQQP